MRLDGKRYNQHLISLHFPETKGHREKLESNFRSICIFLPSFTFTFLMILFIKTQKTIEMIFHFVSSLAI